MEENEEKVCGCRHFQPMPRERYGRRKVRGGFYNSVFEKLGMWEEGMDNGLGKDEMETIRDQFVILLFRCLCDGLETKKGKIQHRHMILTCEHESAFVEIWKGKVPYEFPSKGRTKKCAKIKNTFQLVPNIVYKSQPKSSCDGGRNRENLMDSEVLSYFHINRPLHPHSIVIICTPFPRGIEKLLLEQLGNKNLSSWEKVTQLLTDSWDHLKWNVPIHVTG
ncbi:uncharacterized protein TNCV_1100721 [Trichonephila clavipes]|nr:uncharacterized protein TNCV_1100721 [Trichonephila clavipes]